MLQARSSTSTAAREHRILAATAIEEGQGRSKASGRPKEERLQDPTFQGSKRQLSDSAQCWLMQLASLRRTTGRHISPWEFRAVEKIQATLGTAGGAKSNQGSQWLEGTVPALWLLHSCLRRSILPGLANAPTVCLMIITLEMCQGCSQAQRLTG